MSANFHGKKVIVVGGSAGMGRETATDVVSGGGSAVIIGRSSARVNENRRRTVQQGASVGYHG